MKKPKLRNSIVELGPLVEENFGLWFDYWDNPEGCTNWDPKEELLARQKGADTEVLEDDEGIPHRPKDPGGRKDDKGKLRLDLITPEMEESLGRVLTYGAKKYTDNNWRQGIVYSRILAAMKRHINEFSRGVDVDPESGLRHIDHAFCNLAFLVTFIEEQRTDLDDRYVRNGVNDAK